MPMTTLFVLLLAMAPAVQSTTTTTTKSTASAAETSALGTWNMTFNSQQGEIPAQVTLKKAGEKIVGEISSQMGSSPLEAEVKDKTLSIWFNFQGQSGPVAGIAAPPSELRTSSSRSIARFRARRTAGEANGCRCELNAIRNW